MTTNVNEEPHRTQTELFCRGIWCLWMSLEHLQTSANVDGPSKTYNSSSCLLQNTIHQRSLLKTPQCQAPRMPPPMALLCATQLKGPSPYWAIRADGTHFRCPWLYMQYSRIPFAQWRLGLKEGEATGPPFGPPGLRQFSGRRVAPLPASEAAPGRTGREELGFEVLGTCLWVSQCKRRFPARHGGTPIAGWSGKWLGEPPFTETSKSM